MKQGSTESDGHERHADVAIQVTGLVLAITGLVILLVLSAVEADGLALVAVAIYGASLLGMFSCSIMNALARQPGRKAWCMALDHSAIYALIAGTYTPFCLLVVGGVRGNILLAAEWSAALLGMGARVLFRRWLSEARITLYVLMGWTGLGAMPSMFEHLPVLGSALLLTGGVIYTAAAPLYRWTGLRYHTALWHACVVVAACCHYGAIVQALNSYVA